MVEAVVRRTVTAWCALLLGNLCISGICGSGTAYAQGEIPQDIGMLQQSIVVPFEPVSVYALQEVGPGSVKQFRAVSYAPGDVKPPPGSNATLTVGAAVRQNRQLGDASTFHFTFFVTGIEGQFAATEMQGWTWKKLAENTLPFSIMERELQVFEKEVAELESANHETESKLALLREQASKIAEVDELIDLKSELANTKGFDERKLDEITRLRALAEIGRTGPTDPAVDLMRVQLSTQLSEAAKATAMSDRLNRRKRDAAMASYRRKLDLIRRNEGIDPQELAKEILRLRKRRKELEALVAQRNGQSRGDNNDEF